jgi:hypothetical protein
MRLKSATGFQPVRAFSAADVGAPDSVVKYVKDQTAGGCICPGGTA